MSRWLPVLGVMLLGSGCSWVTGFLRGTDNSAPPAELVEIATPISIEKLWETEVGSGTEGSFVKLSPAVDSGTVYAASFSGEVAALNSDSGEERWKIETEEPISAGVGLSENFALVGTNTGQVLALRREDGTEAWRTQVSSEILATPRAADGVVVVRTVDGKFTGLNENSGEQLWVYQYTVPVLTLRGTAPPLLGQGVAIAGLDSGKLVAISLKDGIPVLEMTIAPPRGRTELDRLVDVDAEPKAIGAVLFVAAYQGNISAIDLRNGNTIWAREISIHSGLDVSPQGVYVSDADDSVWGLDLRTGNTRWEQPALSGRSLSAPVVSQDYVVVGDFEGYLHWLDSNTGQIVGRVEVSDEGIGVAPVGDGGSLFVLANDGTLSAFRAR